MASIKLKGDTSGEVTISAPSVAGTTTLELPATSSTLATQNALGVRNLIINGDMRIAQRGTSAVSGSPDFPVDRWRIVSNQSSKFTAQQSSDVPTGQGFKNSIVFTSSSAYTEASGDYFLVQHRFEGNNIEHLHYGNASAKTVTVSFWVKSSLTGTFAGALRDGGSYTTSYVFEYTISSANTWEYKTVTISGPTSGTWLTGNSVGAELSFALGGGSDFNGTASAWQSTNDFITSSANRLVNTNGATLYITGIQLEVGDTATPFEHRPYDMELQRCLRYCYQQTFTDNFENIVGVACYSASAAFGVIRYPVIMRTAPTFSFGGVIGQFGVFHSGAGRYLTSFSPNEISSSTMQLGCIVASGFTGGHAGWLRLYNIAVDGSQYIRFDAEL